MTRVLPEPSGPTINSDILRIDPPTLKGAAGVPSTTLHEAAGRIGALPSAIQVATRGLSICGPAVTVHSPGGDNLWLHRAIYVAKPGDVLVVYTNGVYDYGYWGEIMSTAAKVRGLGGLVIDACVRDADALSKVGLPVFSRGFCVRGTDKDYGAIGWINAPIYFGGIIVKPGDLIVGDADGVVAIPRERASEVVNAGQAREIKEVDIMERLRAGERTLEVYNF